MGLIKKYLLTRQCVKLALPNYEGMYAIHKPHLPDGRGMKSGIRLGYMLPLGSYPKQPVGYLPTSLQAFSRLTNRFFLVHRITDETMFM